MTTIAPLQPGEKLNHYQVVERVGAGGSSIVYRGHDALLGRDVAIKQLLPAIDDAAFRKRFRQEAKLQQAVTEAHDGVVHLVDALEHERGVFLVMEYVDGYTLEQLLMRTGNAIDATQTLRVIWAAAKGLQAIHDKGVLHRDLKPSNLIVVRQPAGAQEVYPIKIADLGVATLIAEQEAMSLGSVRYMAPELFGDGAADGRCDVYSLGMILYEMLVGRSAFQDAFKAIFKDERNQALRWMKWHTNARLVAPQAHTLNPALPETLSQLCARATAKDIYDRIQSADELAATIERHFTTSGVAQHIDERVDARRTAAAGAVAVRSAGDTDALAQAGAKRRRWPYVAVAGSVLGTAAIVGAVLVSQRDDGPALDDVRAWATEAEADWRSGDLDGALTGYQRVLAADGDGDDAGRLPPALRDEAQAGLLTVTARRAIDAGDLGGARDALGELQSIPAADAAVVDALRAELRNRQVFERHATQITAALDAGRLVDARQGIDALRRERLTLLDAEADRLAEMDAREVGLRSHQAMRNDMDEVERLVLEGAVDDATARLRRMESQYAEPEVAQRLGELLNEQRYSAAIAAAQARLDEADLVGAIARYAEALEARPGDAQLAERLAGLRVQEAVSRGEDLLGAGRADAARDAFREALSYGSSPEALAQLGDLDTAEERAGLVRRGDEARLAGDFDRAINLYDAALGLSDDPAVRDKRQQARVGAFLAEADDAFNAGRLEEAGGLYQRALDLNRDSPRALQGLASVRQAARYEQLLTKAAAAQEDSRFGEALRAYRDAQSIIDTEQVRRRIDETEFQQYIAQARAAMGQDDPRTARALLETARRIRDADVVTRLLAEVDAMEER